MGRNDPQYIIYINIEMTLNILPSIMGRNDPQSSMYRENLH